MWHYKTHDNISLSENFNKACSIAPFDDDAYKAFNNDCMTNDL